MKQALVKHGMVIPVQVPEPTIKAGSLKIRVLYSCVSTGTEIKGVIDSKRSLIKKAIDSPDKVKMALEMLATKGFKKTAKKIAASEDSMKSQGYSISGVVTEIGNGVTGFQVGDLVSGSGQGFAVHAEYVVIPMNLVTKAPAGIKAEYVSIGTIGSISLHGVRRADLKLGEFCVVYGAGLLGLLALQMLRASGVRVACIDINESRLIKAIQLGAEITINSNNEDAVLAVNNWTHGFGADAVLYTAASSEPKLISQSFKMCRRKGRVVVVGVAPLNIDRSDMYKNEIDLMISSSYGPGRYDDRYELEGVDYPYAYVRWTENRNIYEFLRLIQDGAVLIEPLEPVIYSIDNVTQAYADLEEKASTQLISILDYHATAFIENQDNQKQDCSVSLSPIITRNKNQMIRVGLIGAGGFATGALLPIIVSMKDKFQIKTIANRNGEKAHKVASQFNAPIATSDYQNILKDDEIDLVMICTRHNNHASFVLEALKRGKHVYVEKPLATNETELRLIEELYESNAIKTQLMVGFNRRYSVYTREILKHCVDRQSPLYIRYRMNAGFIPYDTWVHKDGGRIVGEACHIIDLMVCLTCSEIKEISVNAISPSAGRYEGSDSKSVVIKFIDGSVGVLDYFAIGSKELSKEHMEVHFDGKSIIVDDYKTITGYGIKVKNLSSKLSRKGHEEEWLAVYDAIKTGVAPISIKSLIDTTRVSILAAQID